MTLDELICIYPHAFVDFVDFSAIQELGLSIKPHKGKPIKIRSWYELFDHTKTNFNLSNLAKDSPLYYKLCGYSFDWVQKVPGLRINPSLEVFWEGKGYHPNKAHELAVMHWNVWAKKKIIKFCGLHLYSSERYLHLGWSLDEAEEKASSARKYNRERHELAMDARRTSGVKQPNPFNINCWLDRGFNEEEAALKVQERHANNRSARTTKYWIEKGFTEEEAKVKVSKFQSDSAKGLIRTMIQNGTRNRSCPRHKDYYIYRGATEEEAIVQLSNFQRRDKAFFVQKYGEEEGLIRHANKTAKWQDSMKSKPKEEIERINNSKACGNWEWALKVANGDIDLATTLRNNLTIKRRNSVVKNNICQGFSKESIAYFEPIVEYAKFLIPEIKVRWKGDEYWLKSPKSVVSYDLTFPEIALIIEYHGVAFHPRYGDFLWRNPYGLTYQHQITKDAMKRNLAIENGFTFIEVWSDDKLSYNFVKGILDEKINSYFGPAI